MSNNEFLRRNNMDKIAALTGAGVGAGASIAAGTAIAGASTGVFGGILGTLGFAAVASNPVGWLVGGAILGSAALYGGSKLVGGKGYSDGDTAAHKRFNSDFEKKTYMKITTKISQKDNNTAKELLNKVPAEFEEWKITAIDGLEQGSMPATGIIQMCCEVLNEDPNEYLNDNNFSIEEIELTIKLGILMALADGKLTDDESALIYKHVSDFFGLNKILDDAEIDLIFDQALGSEKQQEQLFAMSFNEIQNLFVAFLFTIQNDRLILMLVEFLEEVINADGYADDNESLLYALFADLIYSSNLSNDYLTALEKINNSRSIDLYSHNNENKDSFAKKRNNALNAYAKNIVGEMVISLYDGTLFGKADEGYIVTPLAIITDSKDNHIIPLSSIYAVDFDEDENLIIYGEPNENNQMDAIYLFQYGVDEKNDISSFLEKISEINILHYNNHDEESEEEVIQYDDIEEWHLAHNGTQFGAHSLKDIDIKFRDKHLLADGLLAWKEGMGEWKLATEVEEINSIIEQYKVATPPPLPSSPPPLPS